jgi:hypothetical protein
MDNGGLDPTQLGSQAPHADDVLGSFGQLSDPGLRPLLFPAVRKFVKTVPGCERTGERPVVIEKAASRQRDLASVREQGMAQRGIIGQTEARRIDDHNR